MRNPDDSKSSRKSTWRSRIVAAFLALGGTASAKFAWEAIDFVWSFPGRIEDSGSWVRFGAPVIWPALAVVGFGGAFVALLPDLRTGSYRLFGFIKRAATRQRYRLRSPIYYVDSPQQHKTTSQGAFGSDPNVELSLSSVEDAQLWIQGYFLSSDILWFIEQHGPDFDDAKTSWQACRVFRAKYYVVIRRYVDSWSYENAERSAAASLGPELHRLCESMDTEHDLARLARVLHDSALMCDPTRLTQ